MTRISDSFFGAAASSGESLSPRVDALQLTGVVTLAVGGAAWVVSRVELLRSILPVAEVQIAVAVISAAVIAGVLYLRMRTMGDERLGWVAPGFLVAGTLMYLTVDQLSNISTGESFDLVALQRTMALHLWWHAALALAVLGGLLAETRVGLRRVFLAVAMVGGVALAASPAAPTLFDVAARTVSVLYLVLMLGTMVLVVVASIGWLRAMGSRPSVAHAWVGVTLALLVVEFVFQVRGFSGSAQMFTASVLVQALAFFIGVIGQGLGLQRTLRARFDFERQVAERYEASLLPAEDAETSPITASDVAAVLRDGTLTMVFQPIVDLDTSDISSWESLARFPTLADGTYCPPNQWFDAADRFGLGVQLEVAAARQACAATGRLVAGQRIALNFSPATVLTPAARQLLDGVDGGKLTVEITEHAQVADYGELLAALTPFREAGCLVAVDDCGAGFAGLQHITQLRPDVLKLDMSLVRGIDGMPLNRAMVASLVAYADRVGAAIVAEGVETSMEAMTLTLLGAHKGQGYLFARPLPVEEAPWGASIAPAAAHAGR